MVFLDKLYLYDIMQWERVHIRVPHAFLRECRRLMSSSGDNHLNQFPHISAKSLSAYPARGKAVRTDWTRAAQICRSFQFFTMNSLKFRVLFRIIDTYRKFRYTIIEIVHNQLRFPSVLPIPSAGGNFILPGITMQLCQHKFK